MSAHERNPGEFEDACDLLETLLGVEVDRRPVGCVHDVEDAVRALEDPLQAGPRQGTPDALAPPVRVHHAPAEEPPGRDVASSECDRVVPADPAVPDDLARRLGHEENLALLRRQREPFRPRLRLASLAAGGQSSTCQQVRRLDQPDNHVGQRCSVVVRAVVSAEFHHSGSHCCTTTDVPKTRPELRTPTPDGL